MTIPAARFLWCIGFFPKIDLALNSVVVRWVRRQRTQQRLLAIKPVHYKREVISDAAYGLSK
jgi:hypothetical protein